LQGPEVKITEESQLPQAMTEACHFCMLQLLPVSLHTSSASDRWSCLNLQKEDTPVELSPVLKEFADLFQEPTGLPFSQGNFYHRIPIKMAS